MFLVHGWKCSCGFVAQWTSNFPEKIISETCRLLALSLLLHLRLTFLTHRLPHSLLHSSNSLPLVSPPPPHILFFLNSSSSLSLPPPLHPLPYPHLWTRAVAKKQAESSGFHRHLIFFILLFFPSNRIFATSRHQLPASFSLSSSCYSSFPLTMD